MTFEQQWIEYDYNPFLLFSSSGKVLSLNEQAQFLLSAVNTQEIFELATTYASVSFGFKTTFVELEFGRYKFFGMTVGYENEEEIGIKLYQMPVFKVKSPKKSGELSNIYALIDLCISTNSIGSKQEFTKDLDPTIPEIILDSTSFIKLLNKAYACYKSSQAVQTKLYFRVGEHVKYENQKYTLFCVEVSAESYDEERLNELRQYATNSNFYVDIKKSVSINVPIITS